MTRLEQLISDLEYITNSLRALREIHASGSCNDCGQAKTCVCRPDWGERVRYNCPFYVGRSDDTEDGPKIDSGTVVDFVKYLNEELLKYAHATMSNQELQSANRRIAKNFIEEYGE